MTPNRRRSTRRRSDRWRWLVRENYYRDVWMLILSGLLLWAAIAGHNESQARRDQTCIVFERQYQSDIHQLRTTYDYLVRLSPDEAKAPLNLAVRKQLPRLESQVRSDRPPAYCSEPGIGLDDHSFRPVPKRPRGLPQR